MRWSGAACAASRSSRCRTPAATKASPNRSASRLPTSGGASSRIPVCSASGANNAPARLAEFLCCLPKAEVPAGLSYENVFRVTIVQFMDRFNFCLGGVKRSCIHFVTPNGQIIPFDTYNLFYRDGRIDGIRARLARAKEEQLA